LKANNLLPNRHARYSSMTQFTLPLKMEPSRQDTIDT